MSIKKVLYVTTQITGTWRYFSWCSFPSIWYSRIQRQVIEILATRTDLETYVKFYPNDLCANPNISFVSSYCTNIAIVNKDLVSILKQMDFDLIITEASATTLLEMLCTASQIIAFIPMDFIKLKREAKKLLAKRIFLIEKDVEYINFLKDLIERRADIEMKRLNDEFLFKYGINVFNLSASTLFKDFFESNIC